MKKYIVALLAIGAIAASCGSRHNHSADDGHDHSADAHNFEREDHADEKANFDHTDEIVFTQEQAQATGLQTEIVKPGGFRHVIKTSGQIQPSQGDETTIVATSAGIVSFANASITEGMAVRAGETIVTVSAGNLQDGDPAARARMEFENAKQEYERAEGLIGDRIISQRDFEQAKLRYETAKNTYEAQSANVTADGIKVTTPMSGYIKTRFVNQGDYVSVGQPIAAVSQNRKLQLRAEVPEKYFSMLNGISGANFKMAYSDVLYKLEDLNGRLLSSGKVSGQQSFYVPVTFEFDNVGDIVAGSFTEVWLLGVPQDNVLSVPVSALTEEQGLYFVYLKTAPEDYRKQEVGVGRNDGERVQVLSGLKFGDEVVTKGVYQVKLAGTSAVIPHGHTH